MSPAKDGLLRVSRDEANSETLSDLRWFKSYRIVEKSFVLLMVRSPHVYKQPGILFARVVFPPQTPAINCPRLYPPPVSHDPAYAP